jgi:hypothetical protein
VINPSHITSFSSRDFLKQSLAGTSAFSLELSPQEFKSSFGLLNNTTIKEPCVACDCEVIYSEVNTQNDTLRATVLLNGINLFRESENEKAYAFSINPENALRYFPVEIFFVAGRNVELELLTCFEQPQDKNIAFEVSTAGKVVSDGSLFDNWFVFSFLDHSASLTYASNSELRWQGLPEMLIDERMEFNIIPNLPAPSIIDAELQSPSISFDGSGYFISGVNLDFSTDGCSHNTCKEQQIFKTIGNDEETGFLPYLKIGVSALTTL